MIATENTSITSLWSDASKSTTFILFLYYLLLHVTHMSTLKGVLGGTLAGIPSQGSSRGESWLEEPSQGSPRTPVVETLSCGRKGSLRKGGNLLWQARPPGLRAFPGLNGTLVPAPRESNFRNTSSSRGSRTLELTLEFSRLVQMYR